MRKCPQGNETVTSDCPTPECRFRASAALRKAWRTAENEAVLARTLLTGWGVILLGVILAVPPQIAAGAQQPAPRPHAIPPSGLRVDINHATADELMKVPGMTRTWAGRIVRFRPYRSKLDLIDRGVVTSRVYDRIKDYVIAHRPGQ